MDFFESTMINLYLLILVLSFILFIFYFFFGEAFNEMKQISIFLNPSLLLPFLIFFSGTGYVLQRFTALPILLIGVIAIAIGFIFCLLIHYFILAPKEKINNEN